MIQNVDDKSDMEYLLSGGGIDTPEPYVDPVVTVFFGMQHVQLARHDDARYEGRWAAVWEHGDGRAYRSYRRTAAGAVLATLWRAAREARR